MQNLANLVAFGEKEPYMKQFNAFIDEYRDQMRAYIDRIVVSRP